MSPLWVNNNDFQAIYLQTAKKLTIQEMAQLNDEWLCRKWTEYPRHRIKQAKMQQIRLAQLLNAKNKTIFLYISNQMLQTVVEIN